MADGNSLAAAFKTEGKPEEQTLARKLQDVLDGPFADVRNMAREFIARPEMAPPPADLPKAEYREKTLDRVRMLVAEGFTKMPYAVENGGQGKGSAYINIGEMLAHADMSLAVKQGVQFGLFGTSIERLGTEKHQHLIKDVMDCKLLGGFGMTEKACGSDVQGTQTIAVFDPKTREFEIETPNPEAVKTYIGNAAKHGRMMVVFAQLQMAPGEESKGVHAFLVPVRDEQGNTMPGVTIGDNGHKVGLNGVDNGTLEFHKVRIPYDAMLDKFSQIDAKGEYKSDIEKKSARFFKMIGTLVTGRVFVSMAALSGSKTALAAAVEFAEGRKVFGDTLLDKQATQTRLMPKIAEAYALHFATRDLLTAFEKNDPRTETMAAALKAVSSDRAMDSVDEGRKLAGGKGFMSEERYGQLRGDMDVFRTFEGDNLILRMLVAKNQMTRLSKKFSGASLVGKMIKGYDMGRQDRWARWGADSKEFLVAQDQVDLFASRERTMMHKLVKKAKSLADHYEKSEVANLIQDDMAAYSDAYAERLMMERFVKTVEAQKDPEVKAVLKDMCDLYAVHTLRKNAVWYLENNFLGTDATHSLVRLEHDLNAKLRPQAQTLVNGWGIPAQLLHGTAPEQDAKPATKPAAPGVF